MLNKIQDLERKVQKLSREELAAFRDWFRKYDSDEWDRQIEQDIRAGRLENLAKEAMAEYKSGGAKEI
jgi:hypothetical protein